VTRRLEGDQNTVPYNAAMLRLWRANMDLQLVSGAHAAAVYVTGYITKAETAGLREAVSEGLSRLPDTCTVRQQLQRIGTVLLASREYSLQEATYLLTGLPLRGSSCTTIKIGVGFLEHRAGIVSSDALRDAAGRNEEGAAADEGEGEDDDDNAEDALTANLYVWYSLRPPSLEGTTLFELATTYHIRSSSSNAALPIYRLGAQEPSRWLVARAKPAIARIYPRMSVESHGDEYFYSMLQLHVPWRNEELNIPRNGLEERFMRHEQRIRARLDGQRFGDEVEAAVERLRALDGDAGDMFQAPEDPGLQHHADGVHGGDNPFLAMDPDGAAAEGLPGQGDGGAVRLADVIEALAGTDDAGRGRMTDAAWEEAQRRMGPEQAAVLDIVRNHVRDTQRHNQLVATRRAAAGNGTGDVGLDAM
jgi:hypothetical protein